MKTAQKKQVVAFRSFVRTVVHEMLHHLDYEHFGLEETFHTEGFYKRESSLSNGIFAAAGIPPPEPKPDECGKIAVPRSVATLNSEGQARVPKLQPRSLNRDPSRDDETESMSPAAVARQGATQ
jgi:hypothetical protein